MIAQMRTIGTMRISPDGDAVAYLEDYNQRADLWVLPLRGGGRPRLITADMTNAFAAGWNHPLTGGYGAGFAWTPDSAALIYTGAEDGKLYRVRRAGGRAEQLTSGPGMHLMPNIARDGSLLTYCVDHGDVDDRVFVAVQTLDTVIPATRRITPDGVFAIDPQLSSDGATIACAFFPLRQRWAHEAQIAAIDLASGEIRVLTPCDDVLNYAPRWSPDGQTIAFLSDRSGYANVWLIPASGGGARPLATEEREQSDPRWSHDGRRIAFTRTADADRQIFVANVDAGTTERVSHEPGFHTELSWSPDDAQILALHQSPREAPRGLLHNLQAGKASVLIEGASAGLTDPDQIVYPEHVWWTSTDGTEIPGLLYLPKRIVPNGHPALIRVHGGPTSQAPMNWEPVLQYFVARGWVVLAPNYRGSSGYGRRFADLLHGAWGDGDLDDVLTGVSVLRQRELVDERRIAAWGSSAGGIGAYGGMMTRPGTFAAAIVNAGITSFPALREYSDRYGRYLPDAELGPMADHYDLWVKHSPITSVAQTVGPLLILQGSADRRIPPIMSEQMVNALTEAGKTVFYHVYDGEGHGWRQCATIRDSIHRMDAFLTKYVLER